MLSCFDIHGRPSETIHEIHTKRESPVRVISWIVLVQGKEMRLANPGIADKTLCFCYCFSYERAAATRSFHRKGVAADSTPAHASAGAALADPNALQLGATGRHDAFVSGSGETQRSPLSRSVGRGRGNSGAAWLPATLTRP